MNVAPFSRRRCLLVPPAGLYRFTLAVVVAMVAVLAGKIIDVPALPAALEVVPAIHDGSLVNDGPESTPESHKEAGS